MCPRPTVADERPEFVAAYQRVRATVVEDRLDDMIEITDRDDPRPVGQARGGSTHDQGLAGPVWRSMGAFRRKVILLGPAVRDA